MPKMKIKLCERHIQIYLAFFEKTGYFFPMELEQNDEKHSHLIQWVECSLVLGVQWESGKVYTVPLWHDGTTLYPQHNCKKRIVSQGRLSAAQN